jgi:5-methylcytosine-specific restriction endonuclease McrBC regulatory subunit McrC
MFNGKTFELDRIVFENVTKEMMRKIDRIFKHKHLLIDGVGYVTKEQPEVEHLGESNLYDVIVVVLKKDSGIGITENSRQVEMPSLLEIDDVGYLEIK